MADATATMEVRKPSDSVGVVDITGDITAGSEEVLMDAYGKAGDGTKAVILNFSGLEYMNSGGIGLLVTLLVRANRARQKLLGVAPKGLVRDRDSRGAAHPGDPTGREAG